MNWGLMFASQQLCGLKVLQRNRYDLQLSLKAEGLTINFSKVATSSDVSPQITLIHNL